MALRVRHVSIASTSCDVVIIADRKSIGTAQRSGCATGGMACRERPVGHRLRRAGRAGARRGDAGRGDAGRGGAGRSGRGKRRLLARDRVRRQ